MSSSGNRPRSLSYPSYCRDKLPQKTADSSQPVKALQRKCITRFAHQEQAPILPPSPLSVTATSASSIPGTLPSQDLTTEPPSAEAPTPPNQESPATGLDGSFEEDDTEPSAPTSKPRSKEPSLSLLVLATGNATIAGIQQGTIDPDLSVVLPTVITSLPTSAPTRLPSRLVPDDEPETAHVEDVLEYMSPLSKTNSRGWEIGPPEDENDV